jgi:hypothetical protein
MPPTAHNRSEVLVRGSLVDAAVATTRLVVQPSQLLALIPDHQRCALDALLELLTAELDRNEAAQPNPPNPAYGQPGWSEAPG